MRTDTETTCHCGGNYAGSDHCPACGCEQYESYACEDASEPYRFNPADHLDTGTIYYGPAPAPTVVESPRVHELSDAYSAYAATQTTDDIRTGDVLLCDDVIGIMVEAWPVALYGDGESIGFHELSPDADPRWIGQQAWGRLNTWTFEGRPVVDFLPPCGGYDLTASLALAATLANR